MNKEEAETLSDKLLSLENEFKKIDDEYLTGVVALETKRGDQRKKLEAEASGSLSYLLNSIRVAFFNRYTEGIFLQHGSLVMIIHEVRDVVRLGDFVYTEYPRASDDCFGLKRGEWHHRVSSRGLFVVPVDVATWVPGRTFGKREIHYVVDAEGRIVGKASLKSSYPLLFNNENFRDYDYCIAPLLKYGENKETLQYHNCDAHDLKEVWGDVSIYNTLVFPEEDLCTLPALLGSREPGPYHLEIKKRLLLRKLP